MASPPRPIAFVLASTDHGSMIVSRFDSVTFDNGYSVGVGFRLFSHSRYEPEEAELVRRLLDARRDHFGEGVTALDIGANIGVFTVEWSRHMTGWGQVVAFEAQERIFQALCGNVALNNCFNAHTVFAAVATQAGTMRIPVPNYFAPGSFGSLELRPRANGEDIGQPVDYRDEHMMTVPTVSVDSMNFSRIDLIKVDVEGMEIDVLEGARQSIERHRPILIIEKIKTDEAALRRFLAEAGYRTFTSPMNIAAFDPADPAIEVLRERPSGA